MNLVATSLRPIAPPEKGALERIREIAERDLRPVVPQIDEKGFYPLNVLKKLGEAGAFSQHHSGFGESDAVDVGLAIRAMSIVAEECLSTAFCTWCHDAFGWYLQNTENSSLRETLQAAAARGAVIGGTGLSNPMKTLSGIETMKLRGERVAGGYRVNGLLPWVSNIEDGHYFGVCFDADAQGARRIAALAQLGVNGVFDRKGAAFIALEGTATRAVAFKDAFVPDDFVLSESLPDFAKRIRAGFILLQTGMAVGLARNCARLMRELTARSQLLNAYLSVGPVEIEDRLEELEHEVMLLADTPFEEDGEYVERVLRARLAGSSLALAASEALMLHAGARAYIKGSVYSRRLRESYFIAIVTPATKHLLMDLAAIKRASRSQ